MVSSGKRYQTILIELKKNNDDAVLPAIQLVDYFKARNTNYCVIASFDGRPSKMLKKMIEFYLTNDILLFPSKTLYEINKLFIDAKKVSTLEVGDMGLKSEWEKVIKGLKIAFGAMEVKK